MDKLKVKIFDLLDGKRITSFTAKDIKEAQMKMNSIGKKIR